MSKLDDEEKEILESFEKGEWESVGDSNRLAQLQSYAKSTIAKDKRITLQLSSMDLDAIQAKAVKQKDLNLDSNRTENNALPPLHRFSRGF